MAAPYQPPAWAQSPTDHWSLLEIKQGVELARHELQAACTTIGRQGDIESLHASLSRLHARIAFDSTGTPWLRDLQSTHGVTVNKKPLPPASIGKDESTSQKAGSRGVVLYPGDLIQLGASTRIYCVDGPASFERGRIRPSPPSNKHAPLRQQQQQPVEAENQEQAPRELSDETVPSQHQKEWDRIKALRYKCENLQTESGRIRAKADMAELTEGQERQLERNDTRQQQLQTQIEEAEESLWTKVFGRSEQQSVRRRAQHNNDDDDDEVDDFYDQTNNETQKESNGSEEQTEETLSAQWDALCSKRRKLQKEVQSAHDTVLSSRNRLATAEEQFFAQNDVDIAVDVHQRAEAKLKGIDLQLDEVEKLLRIVNPKKKLKDRGVAVNEPSREGAKTNPLASATTPSVDHKQIEEPSKEEPAMPPPSMLPPPPKRPKTTEAEIPPLSFMLPPPPRKHRAPGAVLGPSKPPGEMLNESNETSSTGLVDTWQAPTDQDGSGRTKLNEKFGGRY